MSYFDEIEALCAVQAAFSDDFSFVQSERAENEARVMDENNSNSGSGRESGREGGRESGRDGGREGDNGSGGGSGSGRDGGSGSDSSNSSSSSSSSSDSTTASVPFNLMNGDCNSNNNNNNDTLTVDVTVTGTGENNNADNNGNNSNNSNSNNVNNNNNNIHFNVRTMLSEGEMNDIDLNRDSKRVKPKKNMEHCWSVHVRAMCRMCGVNVKADKDRVCSDAWTANEVTKKMKKK